MTEPAPPRHELQDQRSLLRGTAYALAVGAVAIGWACAALSFYGDSARDIGPLETRLSVVLTCAPSTPATHSRCRCRSCTSTRSGRCSPSTT